MRDTEDELRALAKKIETMERHAENISKQVSSHSKGIHLIASQLASTDKKASQALEAFRRLEQGSS